jgi:hypothetical protein
LIRNCYIAIATIAIVMRFSSVGAMMLLCGRQSVTTRAFTFGVTPAISKSRSSRLLFSSSKQEIVKNFVQDVFPKAWNSMGLNELMMVQQIMAGEENSNQTAFKPFFQEIFQEYAQGVTQEVEFLQTTTPSYTLKEALTKYQEHRQTSTGCGPVLAMGHLFLSNQNNKCCEFYSDDDFRELLRLAVLVAGLNNDIQSYQKEDDSWDMVTIWTKMGGKTPEQAVEATIQRHFEVLDEYKQLAQRLLERYPKEEIEPWVVNVCPSMYKGFVSWQSHVQRYKSTTVSSNKDILLERLFPGQLYHVVGEDGSFAGMDKQLKDDINESTMAWAQEVGLVGSIVPPEKIVAADPGLCTLLLFDYYREGIDEPALFMFAKFFVLILVIDDLWEKPAFHDFTKDIVLQHVLAI